MDYQRHIRPAIEWRLRWLIDADYRAGMRQRDQRRASFPFASCDTFRAACHIAVERPGDAAALPALLAHTSSHRRVFVNADLAALLLTGLSDADAQRVELVIHNGDTIPTAEIEAHAHRFRRVHSVNWLGSRDTANPLPIGLENAAYCANGRFELFADLVPHARAGTLARETRTRDLLVAFSDHTNPTERGPARSSLLASGLDVSAPSRLGHKGYQQALRTHRFVASPPGNGPDCHRTWEAMYAGTIPIVIRAAWPFEHRNWPVLIVDTWDEAIERLRGDNALLRQQILADADDDFYAIDFLRAFDPTV